MKKILFITSVALLFNAVSYNKDFIDKMSKFFVTFTNCLFKINNFYPHSKTNTSNKNLSLKRYSPQATQTLSSLDQKSLKRIASKKKYSLGWNNVKTGPIKDYKKLIAANIHNNQLMQKFQHIKPNTKVAFNEKVIERVYYDTNVICVPKYNTFNDNDGILLQSLDEDQFLNELEFEIKLLNIKNRSEKLKSILKNK